MGDNSVLNIAYVNRTKAKIQIQNTKSYFLSRAYINNKHNELFTDIKPPHKTYIFLLFINFYRLSVMKDIQDGVPMVTW